MRRRSPRRATATYSTGAPMGVQEAGEPTSASADSSSRVAARSPRTTRRSARCRPIPSSSVRRGPSGIWWSACSSIAHSWASVRSCGFAHRADVVDALLGRAHVREEQLEHALVANLVRSRPASASSQSLERGPAGVGQLVDGPGAAAGRLGLSGDQPLLLEALELWVDLAVARRPEVARRLVDELLDVVAGLPTERDHPEDHPAGRCQRCRWHSAREYIRPAYGGKIYRAVISVNREALRDFGGGRLRARGTDVSGRAGRTSRRRIVARDGASRGARDGHLGGRHA